MNNVQKQDTWEEALFCVSLKISHIFILLHAFQNTKSNLYSFKKILNYFSCLLLYDAYSMENKHVRKVRVYYIPDKCLVIHENAVWNFLFHISINALSNVVSQFCLNASISLKLIDIQEFLILSFLQPTTRNNSESNE